VGLMTDHEFKPVYPPEIGQQVIWQPGENGNISEFS